jgi:hypothetical protein
MLLRQSADAKGSGGTWAPAVPCEASREAWAHTAANFFVSVTLIVLWESGKHGNSRYGDRNISLLKVLSMKIYMLVLSFCFAPFMNAMEKSSTVSVSPQKNPQSTIMEQLEKAIKQKTRRPLIKVERSTFIGPHCVISSHYYKPARRCQWRPVKRADNSSEAKMVHLFADTAAGLTQLRQADITKEDVFSAILRENAREK